MYRIPNKESGLQILSYDTQELSSDGCRTCTYVSSIKLTYTDSLKVPKCNVVSDTFRTKFTDINSIQFEEVPANTPFNLSTLELNVFIRLFGHKDVDCCKEWSSHESIPEQVVYAKVNNVESVVFFLHGMLYCLPRFGTEGLRGALCLEKYWSNK